MNICIYFSFGYYTLIDGYSIKLAHNSIKFYDKDGNIVELNLEDGVQFYIPLKTDKFKIRLKKNFSRNEAFVIREKDRYQKNYYNLYIPISSVDLSVIGRGEEKVFDGYGLKTWVNMGLKVDNFNYYLDGAYKRQNANDLEYNGNVLVFQDKVQFHDTDKQTKLNELKDEIYSACGFQVDEYKLKEIVKFFNITRKKC